MWLALLIGAALAPTDAALGVPVVTNPAVPSRIRRLINVESGLNDGIATPVVLFALAGAASAEHLEAAPGLAEALLELTIGAAVGAGVGAGGGALLRWARGRGWAAEDFEGLAVLALALAAYAAALVVHGNGFVAAFCAGLAFGAAAGRRGSAELVFTEQVGGLVSLLVWLAFGAIAVPILADRVDWQAVVYAVLSLTVVRMLPVALALLGAGLDWRTVAFVGWFGPRGLASLVFALLAVEELGPAADEAVAVIALTRVPQRHRPRGQRVAAGHPVRPERGGARPGVRGADAGSAGPRTPPPPASGPGQGPVVRRPGPAGLTPRAGEAARRPGGIVADARQRGVAQRRR